ncbi:hypothetical protein D5072_11100 [Dickeya dianthicola]|nr:hypothetical protein D5072_11100 [Dickeya dianthicola]
MAAQPKCVSQILMNIVLNISWKCEAWHIPVILQVAGALALLLGLSLGLALSGPQRAAFKSAPGRFVAHPSH